MVMGIVNESYGKEIILILTCRIAMEFVFSRKFKIIF